MIYLYTEIAAGLVIMAIAGFILGWMLRGLRERISRTR
jgi:hypothetical protein